MESCKRQEIPPDQKIGAHSNRKSLSTFAECALGSQNSTRQARNSYIQQAPGSARATGRAEPSPDETGILWWAQIKTARPAASQNTACSNGCSAGGMSQPRPVPWRPPLKRSRKRNKRRKVNQKAHRGM